MGNEEFLINTVKSLIITNIYCYEFKKAGYWKNILDTIEPGNNFSLNGYTIIRLAYTEILTPELESLASEAMNEVSIEDPTMYDELGEVLNILRTKIG
ncbi:MAG: hypothetical protein VX185_01470 [Pseudomonadota bacterium]|nr:hypothetical protein [Pseudomonadota bacterium]